jgi:hypothetical protein
MLTWAQVSGKMQSPLKWDANRQWMFDLSLDQPIFYLLRDHINMFTDLSKDWTSGPPSTYLTWVPMRYAFNVDLRDYEINAYANDHNIIDKPLLREENGLSPFLRGNDILIWSQRYSRYLERRYATRTLSFRTSTGQRGHRCPSRSALQTSPLALHFQSGTLITYKPRNLLPSS